MGIRSSTRLTSHGIWSEKRGDAVLADGSFQQSQPERPRCENRDQTNDRHPPPCNNNLLAAFSSGDDFGKSGFRFCDGQLHGLVLRFAPDSVTDRPIRTQNRRAGIQEGLDGRSAPKRTGNPGQAHLRKNATEGRPPSNGGARPARISLILLRPPPKHLRVGASGPRLRKNEI